MSAPEGNLSRLFPGGDVSAPVPPGAAWCAWATPRLPGAEITIHVPHSGDKLETQNCVDSSMTYSNSLGEVETGEYSVG